MTYDCGYVRYQGITTLILATDMAKHGDIMNNFKAKIEQGFDFTNSEHIDTVMAKTCFITHTFLILVSNRHILIFVHFMKHSNITTFFGV